MKQANHVLVGSVIERKRCALTWHYRQAHDAKLGADTASDVLQIIKKEMSGKWDVEVMPGKANVEVRPTFINKGEIVKRLVGMYHQPVTTATGTEGGVEFVLCMGDDFTDEDMFRSLNAESGKTLDPSHIFTVTVGASTKVTLAKWHLLDPQDVIDCVALLAGVGQELKPVSEVNLAALSAVEGHLPTKLL